MSMTQQVKPPYSVTMSNRIATFVVTLFVVLSLMASAAISGVVQGRSDPSYDVLTEIVICDQQGSLSVIFVDDAGNRVDPDEHCAELPCRDCLSTVAFNTPPLLTGLAAIGTAHRVGPVVWHDSIPARVSVFKPARAPPTEV